MMGIGILFYQIQMEMEGISSQQQSLASGESITVSKNLDPAQSKNGVYSIQMLDFKDGYNIKANLVDPTGSVITTRSIMMSAFEENFTISQSGNYTLQIQNTGQNETQILGKIGYYPQGSTILDASDFIILIVGLIGLVIGMVYLIKRRGKTDVN
ncbi:MAG: hypothetical protein ACREAN_07610 [Nitrosopumilaceae archaeon]